VQTALTFCSLCIEYTVTLLIAPGLILFEDNTAPELAHFATITDLSLDAHPDLSLREQSMDGMDSCFRKQGQNRAVLEPSSSFMRRATRGASYLGNTHLLLQSACSILFCLVCAAAMLLCSACVRVWYLSVCQPARCSFMYQGLSWVWSHLLAWSLQHC